MSLLFLLSGLSFLTLCSRSNITHFIEQVILLSYLNMLINCHLQVTNKEERRLGFLTINTKRCTVLIYILLQAFDLRDFLKINSNDELLIS